MVLRFRKRPILAWIVFFAAIYRVTSQSCYYPDGSLALDYNFVACDETGVSACCVPSEGDVCLSNHLCNWTGHYWYRGACTDSTWASQKCPNYCPSTNPGEWQVLQSCGGSLYCCPSSDTTDCCTDGSLLFTVSGSQQINSGTEYTASNFASSSPFASATALNTGSLTSAPLSSQTSSTTLTKSPSSSMAPVAIGVGVAAGVLVAAAIIVAFYCVKKSRKQRASRTSQFLLEVPHDKSFNSGSSGQQQKKQQEQQQQQPPPPPPPQLNGPQSYGWGQGGSPAQTPIYEVPGQYPMPPQPPNGPVEKYGREVKEKWTPHEVYEVPG